MVITESKSGTRKRKHRPKSQRGVNPPGSKRNLQGDLQYIKKVNQVHVIEVPEFNVPFCRGFVESEHSERHGSTNSSSHQRLPKKVIPRTKSRQQQGAQEFPRESCADHAPPPSPVHSALGQVSTCKGSS